MMYGSNNKTTLLTTIAEHLKKDGASELLIKTFCQRVDTVLSSKEAVIRESDIKPVDTLTRWENLSIAKKESQHLFQKTALIKLNGGLGTSMGLRKAKSLLSVKEGLSFLDIIIRQVLYLHKTQTCSLPLIFMNSFATEADTLNVLEKYSRLTEAQKDIPFSFVQNRVPKLTKADMLPATYPAKPSLTWCPPGHGDFYTALVEGGLLEKLLESGLEYVFVSNADNLGATLDLNILHYFADQHIPFIMEVAQRTEADKKGGHIAYSSQGHLILRESAQCHPDDASDFQNIQRHQFFNTNNLWINLKALSKLLATHNDILPLPVMVNKKTVDPTDATSTPVYQLETAIGSILSLFDQAQALCVPRSRFAPVKTTNDLLALQSDIYVLNEQGHIVKNPKRENTNILIDLNPDYYKLIDDFSARFPTPPSLLECNSLDVRGDYLFKKHVNIVGDVILENKNKQIIVAAGTILSS